MDITDKNKKEYIDVCKQRSFERIMNYIDDYKIVLDELSNLWDIARTDIKCMNRLYELCQTLCNSPIEKISSYAYTIIDKLDLIFKKFPEYTNV